MPGEKEEGRRYKPILVKYYMAIVTHARHVTIDISITWFIRRD